MWYVSFYHRLRPSISGMRQYIENQAGTILYKIQLVSLETTESIQGTTPFNTIQFKWLSVYLYFITMTSRERHDISKHWQLEGLLNSLCSNIKHKHQSCTALAFCKCIQWQLVDSLTDHRWWGWRLIMSWRHRDVTPWRVPSYGTRDGPILLI